MLSSSFVVVQWLMMVLGVLHVVTGNEFLSQFWHPRTQFVPQPAQLTLVQLDILAVNGSVVVAWGDFDNDYHIDALLFAPANQSLSVYLFQADSFTFAESPTLFVLNVTATLATAQVADFDIDGHLDVLVLPADADDATIYLQDRATQSFSRAPLRVAGINARRQVSIVDANFDLRPDVLGASALTPSVWFNRANESSDSGVSFEATPLAGAAALSLGDTYSALFGDINGDCLADLLLPTTNATTECSPPNLCYLVYVGDAASGGLTLLPNSTLLLRSAVDAALVDVNSDGSLDLLYATSDAATNAAAINVRFNARVTDPAAETLCQVHPIAFARADELVLSRIALTEPIPAAPVGAPVALARTLRFGDFDLDGFVDVLVPALAADGTRRAQLWMNAPCTSDLCGASAPEAVTRRGFVRRVGDDVALLDDAADVLTASFVDLGDKGRLDILLNLANNGSRPLRSATLFNNVPVAGNGFFVQLTSTNGVCKQWCSSPQSTFVRPSPVGSAVSGVTFRFAYLSRDAERVRRTASLLVRTAFCSLELPYELVGFGTADNQVDQFQLAPPLVHAGVAMQRLFDQGVFPAAVVYAWPTPRDDASAWTLEQRLQYGAATFWVVAAMSALTAVLGIVIGVLTWRESEQDRRERAQSAQVFSMSTF
jgi:integrin alpha FG-GAP repeat containing protein 1